MADNYDLLFKVLFIGDTDAGKSSLLVRYVDGTVPSGSSTGTIGVDFKIKTIDVDGHTIKLQAPGQERFRTITSSYYRGANIIMLTFDVADRSSFESVTRLWMIEVERYACDNVVKCLVGNKTDLTKQRVVTVEDAKEVAASLNLSYFETQVLKAQGAVPKASGVSLRASAPPKKKGCSV
ncbi:Rab1, putative [Acanthamoeba castellanii str. Neff]|uniref:Rab1, putative n=1 Tax=Acanthamoeba castellanii (strain ATCC 30010 / Neff) TaxID=1257118 RepID=L8GYC3_ACACF|nr:Rab1, putative [Acanthamoeba castellanii str. Neff]ELR17538.1 Rab1, putative [Acanthamoeba castellanii str. Neff]